EPYNFADAQVEQPRADAIGQPLPTGDAPMLGAHGGPALITACDARQHARLRKRFYNCHKTPPQASPAPKPTIATRSPGCACPCRNASSKAMGILAASVLP